MLTGLPVGPQEVANVLWALGKFRDRNVPKATVSGLALAANAAAVHMTVRELVCTLWGLASLPESRSGVPFAARSILHKQGPLEEAAAAVAAGRAFDEQHPLEDRQQGAEGFGFYEQTRIDCSLPHAAQSSLDAEGPLNGQVSRLLGPDPQEQSTPQGIVPPSVVEREGNAQCAGQPGYGEDIPSPGYETPVAWLWLQRATPELHDALMALLSALEPVVGGLETPGLLLLAQSFLRLGVRVQGGLRRGLEAAAADRAIDMTPQERVLVSQAWLRIGCSLPFGFAALAEEDVEAASYMGHDCRGL
jgi:hypothetical protein